MPIHWSLVDLEFADARGPRTARHSEKSSTGTLTPNSSAPTGPQGMPSTNIQALVKAHIVPIISTLTEDTFERTLTTIRSETRCLVHDPLIAELFCDAINMGEGDFFRFFDLSRFSDCVGLTPLERLILAASIISAPTHQELATQVSRMIQVEFKNAALELCQMPCFEQVNLSSKQVRKLVSNLLSNPQLDLPVLNAMWCQVLIVTIQSKYGRDPVATILHQIFVCLSDPEFVQALLKRFNIPPQENLIAEIMATVWRHFELGEAVGMLQRVACGHHGQQGIGVGCSGREGWDRHREDKVARRNRTGMGTDKKRGWRAQVLSSMGKGHREHVQGGQGGGDGGSGDTEGSAVREQC
ncbi:hypothetical protein B0H14DRAFT_2559712 [Mycena olivaceomarginata]|nr:hypothetical protein B0H14DRAFT_2559712 [Mycena olivaceomarginata]